VSSTLLRQKIDFDTVGTVGDALGDVATGLDGLSRTLDPQAVGKLGEGLGTTAAYLDEKVAPAAADAADRLDDASAGLRTDAKQLAKLLREAPPDLKAAREIHDSLARFGEGMDKMNAALKFQRFDTMREGFRGLESSLTAGAEQVERLSGYTYPVVTFDRFKPNVSKKQFWPEGDQIAEGLRKSAAGVEAAGKEMDALAAGLPQMRGALDESRQVAARTREALAVALKQQDKVEALLKDVPAHAARLADELPKLSGDLARMLRETQRLKDVAAALREAEKGIDAAVARWPELRTTLARSATLLKAMQQQVKQTMEHRKEYEAALRQTLLLTEMFTALLPVFTEQIDHQLQEQEQALDDLGQSIDDVGATLPAYSHTANRMLGAARLLAWLVAAVVGLHGLYLVAGARLGRRYTL
jgi:uncharacterized phage infection (PIP) family protein YhgE